MTIDTRELLILSMIPGVGSTRLISLISHFRESHRVTTAPAKELIHVAGIEKKTALNIVEFFRSPAADGAARFADDQLRRLDKSNTRILRYWDKDFPSNLKNTFDPPAFLFLRGTIAGEDNYSVGIVGTRTASPYGMQIAEQFSEGLAKLGVTTVSGLARGIDTIAHSSTVKAGGRTLAVLGSGVDVIYPPENKDLAERIVSNGALISEYMMGAKPDAQNFPRRNRIISGLALGIIVIETSIEGGAMITAGLAFDQSREVFAVPTAINHKKKSGTNLLIKQDKATLVECVEDVIEILAPQLRHVLHSSRRYEPQPPPSLSMFEQQLYDIMNLDPIHIDALAERAGISTADALVQLLSMEFKGLVKQLPGKMFVRVA